MSPEPSQGLGQVLLGLGKEPLYWLVLFFPLTLVLEFVHVNALWVFVVSAVAIIPLAGLIGRATESLSASLSPALGGLLNATFGNAAELIIALFALRRGPELYPLVKASLTGSIIGNVLLVMGASIVAGGLYYHKQQFNRTAASVGATLLVLASIGLILPAVYYHVLWVRSGLRPEGSPQIRSLSLEIAGILAVIYILNLIFMLKTHRELFSQQAASSDGREEQP